MRMVPLNVRKNKRTTEYDKRTVTCDIGIAQYEDGIIVGMVGLLWVSSMHKHFVVMVGTTGSLKKVLGHLERQKGSYLPQGLLIGPSL